MSDIEQNIEALLSEERVFPPPADFVERAIVNDPEIYDRADADHEAFWADRPSGSRGSPTGIRSWNGSRRG